MVRNAVLALLLALALPASGEIRLVLTDGQVLMVDTAPEIRDGKVYFSLHGSPYHLPLAGVDLEASALAAPPPGTVGGTASEGTHADPPPPASPRRYTDEDLPRLRETAPLANEGSGPGRASGAAEARTPAEVAPPGEAGNLGSWSELDRREAALVKQLKELDERERQVRDQARLLDEEDARRRADYARLPTDPYAVAAAEDWAREVSRRREAIAERGEAIRAQTLRARALLEGVRKEKRELQLGNGQPAR